MVRHVPRWSQQPEGSVEGGVQVARLGFDDGRYLGLLKQRADLGSPSVDRDDEETAFAGAEELARPSQAGKRLLACCSLSGGVRYQNCLNACAHGCLRRLISAA
jgi:hypothetical protein